MKTTKRDLLVHAICDFLIRRFATKEYEALVSCSTRLGAYVLEQGMHGKVLTEAGRQGKEMFHANVTHNL